MTRRPTDAGRPRIGISACLLGRQVRWDGGHRRDPFLTDVLGPYVEWVPVCPEVEIGLGTPRPPIRLERVPPGAVRLVVPETGEDLTERMGEWSASKKQALADLDLCGYVLKKDSPSCGLERVRVHRTRGAPRRDGRGAFAAALVDRLPWLPVEEEDRLGDPAPRERFIGRVFAMHRWHAMQAAGLTHGALDAFHRRHELVLMARDWEGTRRLARLLAEAPRRSDPERLGRRYLGAFAAVMARVPTRRGHAGVLRHLAGRFAGRLDRGDRRELTGAIDDYRSGLLPLIVPVTLLRHHARRLGVPHLEEQVYLEPHPAERILLNRA